jgi:hypothetical protein
MINFCKASGVRYLCAHRHGLLQGYRGPTSLPQLTHCCSISPKQVKQQHLALNLKIEKKTFFGSRLQQGTGTYHTELRTILNTPVQFNNGVLILNFSNTRKDGTG